MGKRIKCHECNGTGKLDGSWYFHCRLCHGKGFLGKPSLRRRFYEWLSAPESLCDSQPLGTGVAK